MARFRIIAVVVSAVVFTFFALVVVRGISAFEERAFVAGRSLLIAGAEHAELELSHGGEQLPEIARSFALDDDVIASTRALGLLLSRSPPGASSPARVKTSIGRLSKRLNERLTAIRSERPELEEHFDSLSVLDGSRTILVTDSAFFRTGMTLGDPSPEEPADDADSTETDESPLSIDALLQQAEAEGQARTTMLVERGERREVVWVGAAVITTRDRINGYVLAEQKLLSLPQSRGVSAMLVIDGEVHIGQAPDGYDPKLGAGSKEPFLLSARPVNSLVPGIGDVPVQPFFVGDRGVGIWAKTFAIPGLPRATGYVLTDVTPLFAELGGFQVMTLALAVIAWLVHVTMIALAGRRLIWGIERVSDFLGKVHQGVADENRLAERKLPHNLHRLARLINKGLERPVGPVAPIAGAPSLDEILKAQNAASDDSTSSEHQTAMGIEDALEVPPMAVPDDLASIDDFDPFNATSGQISAYSGDSEADADEDGYRALSDGVVGAAVPPDPLDPDAQLPSESDAEDALAGLSAPAGPLDGLGEHADHASAEVAPASSVEEVNDNPSDDTETPLAGSAVADLLSKNPPLPELDPSALIEDVEKNDAEQDVVDSSMTDHYREVYEQFVTTREGCGESTEELTFEKFAEKLERSRVAVMSKHACTDVRFSVYVKDGRAALKATPAS